LAKVTKVATATEILSHPTSLPIFIAPAALARLGHPDGEMNLVRAAGKEGILQAVSPVSVWWIESILNIEVDIKQRQLFNR
jgi:L-lactate dehydrogenase (cytochrome)